MAILSDECTGTVAGVTAQNDDGETIDLELLLLPLGIRRPELRPRDRHTGAARKFRPGWASSPIGALTLGGRRHVGAALEKRLLPRFMAPRGRAISWSMKAGERRRLAPKKTASPHRRRLNYEKSMRMAHDRR